MSGWTKVWWEVVPEMRSGMTEGTVGYLEPGVGRWAGEGKT